MDQSHTAQPRSPRELVTYEAVVCLNRIWNRVLGMASDLGPRSGQPSHSSPNGPPLPWPGDDVLSDADALIAGLDKMLALPG